MSEQEDFEFRLRMEREAGAGTAVAEPPQVSMADRMAGSWGGRMLQGAASPVLAGVQMLGGDKGREMVGELDAMKKRGMAADGKDGFDWYGLLGSLAPGAGIAKGVSAALPAAKSIGAKILQGGVTGAATAAAQPVASSPDFWSDKAAQVGTGAVVGGAVPSLMEGGRAAGGVAQRIVEPFTESGRKSILQNYQKRLMGDDPRILADAVAAAKHAKTIVPGSQPTTGEALAEIPGATGIQAHQASIAKMAGVSPQFAERAAQQESARAGVLVPMARNQGALEGEMAVRDTITAPMRQAALSRANIAGMEVPKLQANIDTNKQALAEALVQQKQLAARPVPVEPGALRSAVEIHGVPPKPLQTQQQVTQRQLLPEAIAKRGQNMAESEAALSDLQTKGMQPLTSDRLIASLKGTVSQPGLRASDVVRKSLGEIEDKLKALTNKDGVIEANDLYMVRKEAGNTIKKFADESKNFDQRLTGGLLVNVQKTIDDAIERAGGTGWKKYLEKYQELSRPINRMEAGQSLQKALISPLETSERGQVFGKAVRDTDLSALTDQDRTAVTKVADELARADAYKRAARQTSIAGNEAIPERLGVPLPNLLSRPAMIANFLMKKVGESAEEKIAKEAAMQYLHPAQFAAGQSTVSPRFQPMIDALMRQAAGAAGTGTGRMMQ